MAIEQLLARLDERPTQMDVDLLHEWLMLQTHPDKLARIARQYPTSLEIAEPAALRELELDPDNVHALEAVVTLYSLYSDVRPLDDYIRRLRRADPENIVAMDTDVARLNPLADAAEIETLTARMLSVDPANTRAIAFRAKTLVLNDRADEALTALDAFAASNQLDAKVQRRVMRIKEQLGDLKRTYPHGFMWP